MRERLDEENTVKRHRWPDVKVASLSMFLGKRERALFDIKEAMRHPYITGELGR